MRALLTLLVVGLGCSGLTWAAQEQAHPPSAPATRPADGRPRVAVVAIEAAPETDTRDTWLAVAFEELLTWRLRRVPTLITVPTIRLYQARLELAEPNEALPSWPRVLTALGARRWLSGFCTGPADAVILQLTLNRLDDPNAPPERAIFPAGRWSDVLDQATRWVLARLEIADLDSDVSARVFGWPTKSPSALEYFARATAAMREERPRDVLRYAQEAVECDGKFRSALGLLAQVELVRGEAGRAAAARHLRLVADLARRDGDVLDRANAELALSLIARADESLDAARTRAETALELAAGLNDVYGELAALTWLADLHAAWQPPTGEALSEQERAARATENLQRAIEYQRRMLEILESLEDTVATMPAVTKLALMYERAGQVDAALTCHQQALAIAQSLRTRRHEASAWLYLGQWHRNRKRWDDALNALQRCLELADENSQPTVHIALGVLYAAMPAPDKALAEFELAYADTRKRDDLPSQFTCLREMARARRQLGQHKEGLANLREALDIAEALELPEKEQLRAELDDWKKQQP